MGKVQKISDSQHIVSCHMAFVCMYVCIYVCMYVYMYVCMMYVCMHVCMYVCMMYVCMYVCVWCMYVCIYVCMYVWCMYVCIMYVCMYVCMFRNKAFVCREPSPLTLTQLIRSWMLIVAKLLNKFPPVNETWNFLTVSIVPDRGLCPEPHESNPHSATQHLIL
jgi:hypothetical protein